MEARQEVLDGMLELVNGEEVEGTVKEMDDVSNEGWDTCTGEIKRELYAERQDDNDEFEIFVLFRGGFACITLGK